MLNIGAQISTSVSVDLLLFKVFFQVKTSKENKGNEAVFVFLLICLCCWHLWQVAFEGSSLLPCISSLFCVLPFLAPTSSFVHVSKFNTELQFLIGSLIMFEIGTLRSPERFADPQPPVLSPPASPCIFLYSSSCFFLRPFLVSTPLTWCPDPMLSVFICLSLYSLNNEWSKRRHLSCCYLHFSQVGSKRYVVFNNQVLILAPNAHKETYLILSNWILDFWPTNYFPYFFILMIRQIFLYTFVTETGRTEVTRGHWSQPRSAEEHTHKPWISVD